MKKPKKNLWFKIGCGALCVLLGFSSYIGLVIVGVIAEDKKNSANSTIQEDSSFEGEIYTDNNGSVVGSVDNNGNIVNNQGVTPGTGSTVVNGNTQNPNTGNLTPGTPVVNTQGNSQGNVQNNVQNNSQSVQQTNNLLDENKTAADIVTIYATVMNKAKAEKPGFTKVEYQELPGCSENIVISQGDEHVSEEAVNKLLGFVEDLGVFVPKEKAESEPYIHQKGDGDMSLFPVFSREKGSDLTDPNGIESFTYKVLNNGNVKFSFVLVPENNPEPIAENSNVAPSYTGAVFSPMSKERIDGTVNHPIVGVFAKNIQYSLRYHDCYVEVEFDPDTMQIVNLKQLAFVSIKGSGDVVGVGTIGLERQELYSTVIIKDMQW